MKKWYYFIVVVVLSVLCGSCSMAGINRPDDIKDPNGPGKIDPPVDELIKDIDLEKYSITNVKTKAPRKAESSNDSLELPDYDTYEEYTLE